jgi:LAO/AO transport system kinase
LQEPVMNCKVLNEVLWKWQIQLSSIKADNIRKAKLAKSEFNRALHLFPAKKSGWIPTTATCSAITQDGFQTFGKRLQNLSNRRGNDYFNIKRSDKMNIGCSKPSTNNWN